MASQFQGTEPFPFPVLVGDIGGTNARFAVLDGADAELRAFHPVPTPDFPDIESAIEAALKAGGGASPRSALIAAAGPIEGDAIDLTNADWVIRPPDMIAKLGLVDVALFNDFEAQALALTALRPADLKPIGGGTERHGAKVAVGPGTGLGVGALVLANGLWVPVPGEGGHVSIGPVEPDEFPLWEHIQPEHGRISAEVLLAGRGIVQLYRAVAAAEGGDAPLTTPADITGAALADTDPVAVRTLHLYARLLGRVAGDMALVFMAHGGVYLGGGIAPRILPFLTAGEFRRAFEAKAPHAAVMAEIPTWVMISDSPALVGLAAFAAAPERYGASLEGRRWRSGKG